MTAPSTAKLIQSYTFTPVIVKIINEHAEAQGVSRSVMLENIVRLTFGMPPLVEKEVETVPQKGG
jgi:hypothetical protein